MDYKHGAGRSGYEDFGNFNYGAVALAFGFSENIALRAAGLVQILVDISRQIRKESYKEAMAYGQSHLLDFLKEPPFGDQAKDQEMINWDSDITKRYFCRNFRKKKNLLNTETC